MTRESDKVLKMPSLDELRGRYKEFTRGVAGLKKKGKTNTKTARKQKKGKKSKSSKKNNKSKKK
jgi:hypothetical protein